jgi:type IV secretory pathway protease TraF
MTATLVPTVPTSRTPYRVAALVAPIGPLAIAALRGLLPYDTVDDSATIVAKVAAHPAAESAVLWLSWLALLTLPLGVLVVSGVAMRARPVLGAVAAVLTWVGFGSLTFLVTPDQAALAGVDAGVPAATTATLLTAIDQHPVASTATGVFVAGHIVGTVLLGLALWRAVPRWAALALIVSQPLHFLVAVIVPNHALDALAWVLTTVGFAAAAAAGFRTVDNPESPAAAGAGHA